MKKLEWFDYENKSSGAVLPFGVVVTISFDGLFYRASTNSCCGVIADRFESLEGIKAFIQDFVDAEFKRWEE